MTAEASEIVLSKQDLREVTAFAAACAEMALEIFEADQPDDSRPRDAVGAAWEFARGGERGKSLRDTASAALKAAKSADTAAAREAAWAAMSAAGAAYLHPLAQATQVKHILGAGAYAARAAELVAGDDQSVATEPNAARLGGHRTLQALLAPVYWGPSGGFPAAGGLGDTAVHGQLTKLQTDHAVIRLQGERVDLLGYAEVGPVRDATSDRAVRAAGAGDPLVARAVHQGSDDVLEDDPVGDTGVVAAQRVGVDVLGQQRSELVPQEFEQA